MNTGLHSPPISEHEKKEAEDLFHQATWTTLIGLPLAALVANFSEYPLVGIAIALFCLLSAGGAIDTGSDILERKVNDPCDQGF
jgi:hypothetical protein